MCAPPRARARPSPAAFAGASCGCVAARACVLEDVSSRVSRACAAPSRRAQSVLCLIRLNSCFLVPLFLVAPGLARRAACSGWVAFPTGFVLTGPPRPLGEALELSVLHAQARRVARSASPSWSFRYLACASDADRTRARARKTSRSGEVCLWVLRSASLMTLRGVSPTGEGPYPARRLVRVCEAVETLRPCVAPDTQPARALAPVGQARLRRFRPAVRSW